jgi:predicted HTH transcriptional regulator
MNLGMETEKIEFKKSTAELKQGIISLSAMLNKHGYGTLYFGVKDDGEIAGQQVSTGTLRDVSQAIAGFIKPQVIPTIVLELLDEKNVIKVYAEGNDSPYSAYGRYYMRSADEDRELSPEQLRSLMIRKQETDTISRITNDDQKLSFRLLKTAFIEKGLSVDDATFETNIGLKNDNGKYNLMAGLLADTNSVSIKTVVFKGTDKLEMLRRNEYGNKCLITAMDQVISYIESLNETSVSITAHQRQDSRLFDMACFREAWINACLHTRWDKLNPPAVYVFADRIEIISMGGLPQDLSQEEFFRGISRPVNIKLQKIFGQLGYVEQTGHGIPLIISRYGRQAFDISDNYVNVTIPFSRKPDGHSFSSSLNNAQQTVAGLLKDHPEFTINDLARHTEYSESYIRKIISELRYRNIIKRKGSKKTGSWQVFQGRQSAFRKN